MAKSLLITECHDGLNWREFSRSITPASDFSKLKNRQGSIRESSYFKATWCRNNRVKVEDRLIDGERIRFTRIWQDEDRLIPVRYW